MSSVILSSTETCFYTLSVYYSVVGIKKIRYTLTGALLAVFTGTFISIMLPMAKSTLASLAIIVFTYSWNDYFTTFIMINDTEKLTLPVGILSIKQPFSTGDNVVFAAVVLAILPVLIVFLIGQKWIVKSMTHVGVKG